jgi:peptide/nickel transport system substrate-binding protein
VAAEARPVMNVRAAVLVALLAVVTACTRGGGAPPDTLRMISGADFPGLNPMVVDNGQLPLFAPLFFGYLLRADGGARMIPDLAVVVPTRANGGISRDGRTVTYHLRRGVRWQDGAPFDARDVVFSFAAAMNPRNNVPDRTGFDHVASVRELDRYTVQVRLTRPFSPFVPSCFTLAANDPYPILPAHLLAGKPDINRDPYDALPVGLGPYRVVRWDRGSRLILEADPHYFRGAPAIPRIEVTIVADVNTVATLWKAAELDEVIARVQAGRAFLDQIRSRPDAHVILQPHNEFDFLQFNATRAPLNDERVRRAIVQAIDRGRIMRELDGALWVPGDSDRLPGSFAYDPTLHQPAYDPAAAARTLDAAGWRVGAESVRSKNGHPLTLDFVATAESPTTSRIAILAAQDLARVGIRSTLKAYSYNQIWAPKAENGIFRNERFDLAYSAWDPNGVDDHSYLFRCEDRPPAGDNFFGICDPVIERAAQQELDSPDPAVQAAGDRAISRELVAHSDLLFLGFNREGVAASDRWTGVVPSVTGTHWWNAWTWRLRS